MEVIRCMLQVLEVVLYVLEALEGVRCVLLHMLAVVGVYAVC